jgi:DNA ligase-1
VQRLIEGWLDALDADGRWALLKLMTGGLRVGVSARLAKQACADFGGSRSARSRRSGTPWSRPMATCSPGWKGRSEQPSPDAPGRFRPVMLAQAIDEAVDFAKLDPADYAAEWKWDGIRVQAVSERGERRLYTRTGDDISATFPDVVEALTFEGAIDGELLVMRDGAVASFGDLQQRLNRKTVDAKQLAAFPAGIRAYDLLLDGETDLRGLPFAERRKRLEASSPRPGARGSTCRRSSRSRPGRRWPPCAPSRRPATPPSPRG